MLGGRPKLAQKIKLSTIADALSVSTATVSLALRDSPLVADATRERIKEHARAIGYIYNRRAASLRTSRSGIVGVVVHDIMNPFFAEILRSIESELDRSRQTFLLSNHYDQLEKQRTFIDTLLQLGADGVIMSPAIDTPPEDIRLAEDPVHEGADQRHGQDQRQQRKVIGRKNLLECVHVEART